MGQLIQSTVAGNWAAAAVLIACAMAAPAAILAFFWGFSKLLKSVQ